MKNIIMSIRAGIGIVLIIIILIISLFLSGSIYSQEAISIENGLSEAKVNRILFMIKCPYAKINEDFVLLDPQNDKIEPVIINNRTLVPIRFFAENLGFVVEWDSNERTAIMTKGDKTICLKPDSDVIKINGKEIVLDVSSKIIYNRLYVPLRSINEIVDNNVSYKNGLILITDTDTGIEDYKSDEFAELYLEFVRMNVLHKHEVEALSRWKASYILINYILDYYKKVIPDIDFYCFPDHNTIPEDAYYHAGLAVYLNLLEVKKGDFEPFKSLSDNEINMVLERFEEILLKDPDLDFENVKDTQQDLLSIINDITKDSSDKIRISIYDFATDSTVNVNGQERFYAASLTKVVNLLCFLEEVKAGNLDLKSTYALKESDKHVNRYKVTGTGNLQYEANGSKYTYGDILSRMIGISDNVAANIIFDKLGNDKISSFYERYDLKDTGIYKKFYDANPAVQTNYTTVDDLTKMLVLLENRIVVDDNLSSYGVELMKNTDNKDRIARYTPDNVIVANKIGTLSRLAGDMALVYFPDREPIALTIVIEDKNRKPINEAKVNEIIGKLSKEIIDYYSLYANPSLNVDENPVHESTGLRFINKRPYILYNEALEGYSAEGILIDSENYISLDSLTKDGECTFSLKNYPLRSISINLQP